MATVTEPDYVARHRTRKATQIADACRAAGITADAAAHLSHFDRHRIERAAGTREGSGETWEQVVSMLAGSVRARCPFCGMGDPAGEPGPPLPYGHSGACRR